MHGLQRCAEPLVSAFIVIVLATQAVAGFLDTGRWGWPIVAYPMYKEPHYDGDRVWYDVRTFAVLADGTRVELVRDDLGFDFWVYWQNVVQPIYKQEKRVVRLAPVIAQTCERFDGR